jgi:LacI family repressor for deo operon, udp, cdd, tsx, nupC, and nupG
VRYSVDSVPAQVSLLTHVINRQLVDGLILCSLSLTDETVEILTRSGLPISTVETSHAALWSVGIDNVAAAQMATRYLINLGHQRIGLISGLEDAPLQFAVPIERRRGYLQALEEYGMDYRSELEQPGNYIYEGGAEAMKHLFSVHKPPTAVFALSDEMAIGALKAVRDMNLRVPDDISIIGFDDNDVSEYVGLTTVHQPVVRYGEHAVVEIDRQFAGEDEPDHIELQPRLVVRATTGPAG